MQEEPGNSSPLSIRRNLIRSGVIDADQLLVFDARLFHPVFGVPGLTPRRKAALSVLVPGFAGLYETDPDSRGKLKPGPGERLITELKEYGMAYHNCWHELM